jgi:hypothetical protein
VIAAGLTMAETMGASARLRKYAQARELKLRLRTGARDTGKEGRAGARTAAATRPIPTVMEGAAARRGPRNIA